MNWQENGFHQTPLHYFCTRNMGLTEAADAFQRQASLQTLLLRLRLRLLHYFLGADTATAFSKFFRVL